METVVKPGFHSNTLSWFLDQGRRKVYCENASTDGQSFLTLSLSHTHTFTDRTEHLQRLNALKEKERFCSSLLLIWSCDWACDRSRCPDGRLETLSSLLHDTHTLLLNDPRDLQHSWCYAALKAKCFMNTQTHTNTPTQSSVNACKISTVPHPCDRSRVEWQN